MKHGRWRNVDILKEEFPPMLAKLQRIAENEIPALERQLNSLNTPWTPGRLPVWK